MIAENEAVPVKSKKDRKSRKPSNYVVLDAERVAGGYGIARSLKEARAIVAAITPADGVTAEVLTLCIRERNTVSRTTVTQVKRVKG